MNWQLWALGSAIFAAITAITAKIGVSHVDSNLATAIRTVVIGVFAWTIAWRVGALSEIGNISNRTWIFPASRRALHGSVTFARCN